MILIRCIIKKGSKNYFKGVAFNGTKYRIRKNEESNRFSVGEDRHFYAIKEKGFFTDILIPIADEIVLDGERKQTW